MTSLQPDARTTRPTSLRRVVLSAFAGTSIEWYDFFLFGSAAALVFPAVFFPESDPGVGLLLSFMTYGVAFVVRPLGGIIFGRLGDSIGRKKVLIATLMLMGVGTFLIGCVPGYDTIGIWAAVILVLLRVTQGLGLGGEWGGAATLSAEHADGAGRSVSRGLLASWMQLGVPAGNLLAVGALYVMQAVMPEEQFLAWGWRIPFLASAVLVVFCFWIRAAVEESPLFADEQPDPTPLRTMLRSSWRQVLLTIGIRIASDVSYYVFAVFALSYIANTLQLPPSVGLTGVILGCLAQFAVIPVSAHLSDRVGRRPVYVAGAIAVGVWAFVAWPLIDTTNEALAVLAIAVGIAAQGIMYGPMAAFITEMFPTKVRTTGAGFGYQVAGILGGALAPLLAQLLTQSFATTFAVSVYVAITAVIAVTSSLLAKETSRKTLQ
ncbi:MULTISPECIES: MFS transporter [Microbacterium]|uniref:MFS transporter n=1 Tax=Microbacterium wangchenii TaxID=2541726 RepID=A0ABX5SPZ4_9MICO|nr:MULTISPECIES: MFS transporter [Microbacterium]MCK6067971.1 MHS family MFS transporter [Microbacterium sp. EYE_512]QBR87887.1 MFS transporter [Microbacterium wangchenii]TXK16181.1 MHS family MFS transporter [Microbacterium wangchenii]